MRKISLAVGHSARTKTWKNTEIHWTDFVQKISTENRTSETFKNFINANKADQSSIKDVGGYVGGYLVGGKRSPQTVGHRSFLGLDLDFANTEFWDLFTMYYDNVEAVLHSTHKHCEKSPRYRLIILLDRDVSAEEYVAISRKVAGNLGISLFDPTTFQAERLMFWQSTALDGQWIFKHQKAAPLCADDVLSEYHNWRDVSLYPRCEKESEKVRSDIKKQENPTEKTGVLGAFCRAYSISEAIDAFLPDKYRLESDGRYTYAFGSAASGLVVYDDLFAYSHHGTDPCSGLLCNAFDLVRIHLFSDLDTGGTKKISQQKMLALAGDDEGVRRTLATDKLSTPDVRSSAAEDFGSAPVAASENLDWAADLVINSKGEYLSSAQNLRLIFEHDEVLKKAFKLNQFDNKKYIMCSVPWRKVSKPEPMKNVDMSGVRAYIEQRYGISANLKVEDALNIAQEDKGFNPVTEYLRSVKWDGVPRVDTLLIRYFGAKDTIYTREAVRKMLVGAVGRVMRPGIKFDLVLTLVGKQGDGKSTFLNKLGGAWYSDTLTTIQGKEGLEQIQGCWIIEIAELAGLRKAEVEAIKHFISKQRDTFRPAFGRTSETYERQCIFAATTNKNDFLSDPTGNRRFLPIEVRAHLATQSVFSKDLDNERDQIWAEAVHLYDKGEPLFMSGEADKAATAEQAKYCESDERAGVIEQYLSTPRPENWDTMSLISRRNYIRGIEAGEIAPTPEEIASSELPSWVCVAEIWCECLNKERDDMSRYATRDINNIMRALDGWEQVNSTKNFKLYGKQKFYKRVGLY